jgi:hypothetical protein
MPFADVFHRLVFRRTEMLIGGRIHDYRITGLANLYTFQGAAADPVMHIVAPDGTILAENDDFNGPASESSSPPLHPVPQHSSSARPTQRHRGSAIS